VRRALTPVASASAPTAGVAPLLDSLLRQYRATGLPPASLSKNESDPKESRMTKKLLQLYGLKWNPFASDVPTEALLVTPRVESFTWRVEPLAREGGFAVIVGDPGTGKSITLRLLAARLAALRDVVVGVLTRPQAGLADFYREIGHLFGVRSVPTIAGRAPKRSATPGSPTSRPPCVVPCCSSMKRRTPAPIC